MTEGSLKASKKGLYSLPMASVWAELRFRLVNRWLTCQKKKIKEKKKKEMRKIEKGDENHLHKQCVECTNTNLPFLDIT